MAHLSNARYFFWVCKILKIEQVKSAYLVEDYELSQRSFDSILKIMTKECDLVAKKISSDVAELRKAFRKIYPAPTTTSVPATTSRITRSTSSSSPSKSVMKGKSRDTSPLHAFVLNDVVSFRKTNGSDEDISSPDTPTKKRRLDSPLVRESSRSPADDARGLSAFEAAFSGRNDPDAVPSPHAADINLPTIPSQPGPSTSRRIPRSTHQEKTAERGYNIEIDQRSEQDRGSSSPPQRRRFRPIFLDRTQWSSRDPRIVREWPATMEHKRSMVDLYGHPFQTQVSIDDI